MNPFKQLFSRRRLYIDLSDEIEAHLEEKIEELVQGGMSRKKAVATARREFGNLTLIQEESREVWQWPTIESFLADLRYGIRMLRRNPAFGLAAILILAVGIGANAAVFSIVDSILLKPLPYADQERLMMVRDVGDRDTRTPMSYPEFLGWKDQNQIFESVGAYSFGSVDLTSPGEPQHFDIIRASAELLPMLGTMLRSGRGFTAQEELRAGPPAVIIALQAGNGNLVDRLKIGGRLSAGLSNTQLMRNVLIVAEIAFSLVLLAGAGLLLRSFIRLAHVDKGFDPDHVLTMHIAVSPGKYAEPKREINYLNQIVESTRNLPGVESVDFITNLPFSGDAMSGDFLIQGVAIDPANVSAASKQFVVGEYFSAMHMPLIRGRFLNSTDTNESRPVVVVDQGFVREYFPHEDPIGKHIDVGWGKRGWS
jgi:hypothetical protein